MMYKSGSTGELGKARSFLIARDTEDKLAGRSKESSEQARRDAAVQTLRDMLPSFVASQLPEGKDVISGTIDALAEEMAKYEPGLSEYEIRQELHEAVKSPDLARELESIVENGFMQRFDEFIRHAKEITGPIESTKDIKRIIQLVESAANDSGFQKAWTMGHLVHLEQTLTAEYRSLQRQWDVLKEIFTDADIEHLHHALESDTFEEFFRKGEEIHKSISLTSLNDSPRGREALGIINVEALKQKLARLVDLIDPTHYRALQSERSKLQNEFRLLAKEEQQARKKSYDLEMGRLGKLLKERSPAMDEAKKIFSSTPPTPFINKIIAFVELWGDDDPHEIIRTFKSALIKRNIGWD